MTQQYSALFDVADQFIELANKLSEEDQSGTVGAAIRYAAARYNSFEAAVGHGSEMANERDSLIDSFSDDYRKMLEVNIDDYIQKTVN